MLLQVDAEIKRDVGFDDSDNFNIQASEIAKVFRLLSSSVYANKEASIVREITSNSYDAMVEADKHEPIYVTYKDNRISFVDHGVGMSPEIIDTVYRNLGKTTKSHRSDLIGGYGIGKFSVQSYTDIYYVDTISDGMLYNYVVTKNTQGLPEINRPAPIPTTECNGTTVWFELKDKSDFNKFKRGVENQLKYFRTVITDGFDLDNNYHIYQGKHFVFRPDRLNMSTLEICWGNIYYPIDWVALEMTPIYSNCAIYFPTETPLQPTISREALENQPYILDLIRQKIEDAREELTEKWREGQIINDFFTWCNANTKTIKFPDGSKLDVSAFVTEPYIYGPLVGTSIRSNTLRANWEELIPKLYQWQGRAYGYKSSVLLGISENDKHRRIKNTVLPISTHRLSRIDSSWNVCIRKKLPFENNYSSSVIVSLLYPVDPKTKTLAVKEYLVPDNYRYEIAHLENCIWKDLQKRTECIDNVVIERAKRVTKVARMEEVRGRFHRSDPKLMTLDEISKTRFVVYTDDAKYHTALCDTSFPGNNKFMPVLTTPKYFEKLQSIGAMTVDEFLESDMMKKAYLKQYRKEIALGFNIEPLNRLKDVHVVYKHKYKHIFDFKKEGNYQGIRVSGVIATRMYNRIKSELVSLLRMVANYRTVVEDYNVLYYKSGNAKGFRYHLLYKTLQKKCTRLSKEVTTL